MTRSSPRSGRFSLWAALAALACSDPEVGFVHVEKGRLADGHGPVTLSAIRFENWVGRSDAPALEAHHDEADYERARALGFDTVHLSLGLDRFVQEDSPFLPDEAALAFLDRNVAWAKAHNLRLVFSLEEPAGEAPEACREVAELWEPGPERDRVLALWGAVAERYASETTVAGYQILTSPTPSVSRRRFESLSLDVIATIRNVDAHHLLIVPEVAAVECDYALTLDERFVDLPDENLAYGLAFDWPRDFTAQGLTERGTLLEERYPDRQRLVVDWSPEHITSRGWTDDSVPSATSLALTPSETSWTRKVFGYVPVAPELEVANVALLSRDNLGTVCFDEIVVEAYVDGAYEVVFELDIESHHGWFLWENGGSSDDARWLPGTGRVTTGADGSIGEASVCLSGTTSDASLGHDYLFAIEHGRPYRVSYSIRGEDSAASSLSLVKLDFYSYEPDLEYRDADAMAWRLDERLAHAARKGAPVYVYSIGTSRASFEHGGARWVADALGWARRRGVSFAYRAYRGSEYGLFENEDGPVDPDSMNATLAALLEAPPR